MSEMTVVYTGEELPEKIVKSCFLAGGSSRNQEEVKSWRPEALEMLEKQGYDGTVFVPEGRDGKFKLDYNDQVDWEETCLNVADCILFWVPRDLSPDSNGEPKMACLTTNCEWSRFESSGRVVLGCPEDAEKVSCLKHYAEQYKVPIATTLTDTIAEALKMLGEGSERSGGERYVPLLVWKAPSFQSWYQAQYNAGNRFNSAKLLYTFRPGYKSFVFLWILKVAVYVASEDRVKDNEFGLARPDISSVCLWRSIGGSSIFDREVVLVKEFRSPASTEDCFVRELPSGSSATGEDDPVEVASEELHEETGCHIDPKRFKSHGARQLAGTFSPHKSNLFSVEITAEEMEWFRSQEGIVHGNVADSERTFIEVYSVADLIEKKLTDWMTLGQILAVIAD